MPHIGGLVALLPAGSESEYRSPPSWTKNDSFPVTTFAPPLTVQPAVPLSKPPFEGFAFRNALALKSAVDRRWATHESPTAVESKGHHAQG